MAVINCSTESQITNAMSTAAAGDEIAVASGTYSGTLTKSNVTKGSPFVTIRPQNRSNPPVFNGTAIDWTNCNGFTVDGINFIRTNLNSAGFPTGKIATLNNCDDITFVNCRFQGSKNILTCTNFGRRWLIEFCSFKGWNENAWACFNGADDHTWQNNEFIDALDDPATFSQGIHPDCIQYGSVSTSATVSNITVRDNFFSPNRINCNFYGYDGNDGRFSNITYQRNWIITKDDQGIRLGAGTNVLVELNRLQDGQGANKVNIRLGEGHPVTGTVRNNVTPRAIASFNGDQTTKSGNVVSSSATPTGWATFDVALGIYGPYNQSGGGDPTPDTMEDTPGDAFMFGTYDAGVIGGVQYFSGLIDIPDTSVAWLADPAGIELEHQDVGDTNWRPTDISATQPAGTTNRYRMRGLGGTDFARTYGQSHEDIQLRWRPANTTVWSAASTFTLLYTAPGTPAGGPDVTSVTLNSAAYTVGQTATVNYDYSLGSGALTQVKVEWKRNGTVFRTDITPAPDTGSHPLGMLDSARLTTINTRRQNGTQPQSGTYQAIINAANTALGVTYNPDNEYNFLTGQGSGQGTVGYTRGHFLTHSDAAYTLALAYRLTGSTNYADKAVTILDKWADDDVIFPNNPGGNPDSGSHPGLHIGSHLAPQFMAAADLLHGYAGYTNIANAFEDWWYDRAVVHFRLVLQEKMGGWPGNREAAKNSTTIWAGSNWLESAMNAMLQTAITFEDSPLRTEIIDRLKDYFIGSWRYTFKNYGLPGNFSVPVINQDIERHQGDHLQGLSYTGYGMSSMVQALGAAKRCGTDLFSAATPAGATIAGIAEHWFQCTHNGRDFKNNTGSEGVGGITVERETNEHNNILEVLSRHIPGSMSTAFKNFTEAERPLTGQRNKWATFVDGEDL
jgi:hypothetical protein